ncbi:hypothetical protein H4R23_001538 [Coemansia sp. Cherry 401B]|nr:hypothetical protein H4R23_001538 [Coemansia sp. Cherry 401B]
MAAQTEPRPHYGGAEAGQQQLPLTASSSQTVRADHAKTPVALSECGSTSSLLSLYQQTEDPANKPAAGDAAAATADSGATANGDNAGNVRGAGDRAVDTQHLASESACAADNNNMNNAADVNNNSTSTKNGAASPRERSDSSDGSNGGSQRVSRSPGRQRRVPDDQSSACDNSVGGGRLGHLNSDNGRAGAVPSMTDADYADRFGSYYDYLPIDEEPLSKQRTSGGGGDVGAGDGRSRPESALPLPPPLRSTYKSEPMIRALGGGVAVDTSFSQDLDARNSYSQMLENALFYSQAIEQIRELDTIGVSNPYVAALPRARPGKEDIRQRRARNAIASREVFNITTPSTFIPLPREKFGMPPPMPLDRPLAMRSEPEFKRYAPESRPGSKGAAQTVRHAKAGGSNNSNATAVPISRFLPRGAGQAPGSEPVSRTPTSPRSLADVPGIAASLARRGSDFAFESERRAGLDQPVPSSSDLDEGLKQRGGAESPQTFSSSLRAPRSRARAHSATDSDAPATEDETGSSRGLPDPSVRPPPPAPTQPQSHSNRRSIASHFSSVAESVRIPASANGRPHHPHLHQMSSQSRKVATRLLMRAGFSRIAIRVAQAGKPKDAGVAEGGGVFASSEAMASSVFGSEAASGIDVDPNGLQGLRTERRKQVTHVDEYGFMQFEGDAHESDAQTQQYDAWQTRTGARPRRPTLDVRAASEAKWATLLRSFDAATLRGSRKVKKLVQAGVPPGARARFYYVLSGAAGLEQPGEYARLAGQASLPIYEVIERDVARCYPDHVMFADADGAGQRQLRRILRAYAQYNRAVGYCQGMGRLVGLFLIAGLGEEQAFWVLAATIRGFIPRYYEADLAGLREHTAVFEVLLHERNPRLAAHLAEQGCDALMYATPWFMTVFTMSLPWPAALRVWDWFVFRGTKVLFRVALGISDLASAYLLDACPTIAELLGFLLHIPPGLVDADTVIAAAARVKISERHVERLIQRAAAPG